MLRFVPLVVFALLTGLARAERFPVQSYTAADGLADNHVNRIRQDSRGFLWFATDEGLSRFDGYAFTNYTTAHGLPHRWVNDLIETHDGDYWVATDGGVCHFDASRPPSSKSSFTCYDPGSSKDARRANALVEDAAGFIWCATYDGIYRLENARGHVAFRHVDIGSPAVSEGSLVNNLLLDHRGDLWAASSTGLYRQFQDRWERYSTAHGLPDLFIDTLLEDRNGRLWAGTRSAGFCLLVEQPSQNSSIVERCYSTRDGLAANDVRSLFESSDGRLWIGTVGGLNQLEKTGHITSYTTADGLTDTVIYKFGEDRAGNLWIGTKNAGVMKIERGGFVTYGQSDGFRPSDDVSSIFETTAGQLCAFTGVALHRFIQCFDGHRFTSTVPNIPSELWGGTWGWYQVTVDDVDGNWWVPTAKGLYWFPSLRRGEDAASVRPHLLDATREKFIGITYQDTQGDIWTATRDDHSNQLFRWERSTGTVHSFAGLPVPDTKLATALTRDSSGLWIGFRTIGSQEDGGIVRCNDRPVPTCQAIEGAPHGDIHAFYTDHAGRLWAASSAGGVTRFDNPSETHPSFINYTTASGLSSDEVWCLVEDQWGRIYAGTSHGLDQLDPQTGHIRHFTPADGLGRGRIQAAYRNRSDVLWFATNQGISRLDPVPGIFSSPQIRITNVHIAGAAQALSALGESRIGPLRLGASENSLQIDFIGLDLSPGSPLRYQFLLEGTMQEWSEPTETRTVSFPHLPAGRYQLLIRALNSEGASSSEPARLAFTIAVPVWRRWWFASLAAFSILIAAYALHRYRLAQVLEIERVRSRIASDLHDEIGSSLSRMAILSEVVQRHISPPAAGDSVRMLGDIAASARSLVDAMSDVVWSIDPRRDDLRSLVARVREFASGLLEAGGITWEFHAPAEIDHVRLSPEQRHDVYLIFKEAVANIARHADCTSAHLSLEVGNGWLVAQIRDDGRGFDSDTPRGRGLTSIETRALRSRGRCKIVSAAGEGTTITVFVPLSKRLA